MRKFESNSYVRTVLVIIANLILWLFLLNSKYYLNTSLLIAGASLLVSYLYIKDDYLTIRIGNELIEFNYVLSVFHSTIQLPVNEIQKISIHESKREAFIEVSLNNGQPIKFSILNLTENPEAFESFLKDLINKKVPVTVNGLPYPLPETDTESFLEA